MGLPVYTNEPELTLVSTSMNTEAWGIYNLNALLLLCPAVRSAEDPVIPGAPGRPGFDDEEDETTCSLAGWLTGECNPDGDPFTSVIAGLRINRDELRTNIPTGEIITATIALNDDAGTTISDLVKVAFEFGDATGPTVPFVLHVTVPGGWFGTVATGGS